MDFAVSSEKFRELVSVSDVVSLKGLEDGCLLVLVVKVKGSWVGVCEYWGSVVKGLGGCCL